jgi:hypothetical protein
MNKLDGRLKKYGWLICCEKKNIIFILKKYDWLICYEKKILFFIKSTADKQANRASQTAGTLLADALGCSAEASASPSSDPPSRP